MTSDSDVDSAYMEFLNCMSLMPDNPKKNKALAIAEFLKERARQSELKEKLEKNILGNEI